MLRLTPKLGRFLLALKRPLAQTQQNGIHATLEPDALLWPSQSSEHSPHLTPWAHFERTVTPHCSNLPFQVIHQKCVIKKFWSSQTDSSSQ